MSGGCWMHWARESADGWIIERLRRYILLCRAPPAMFFPLKERVARPSFRMAVTPARSSRDPLMRLDRTAGM